MSSPAAPERPRLPRPRLTRLLPVACVAAAALVAASELMTTFEFIPAGRDAVGEQAAGDRHGYALALIAAFALAATLIAVLGRSKPAAIAVGVAGVLALLVILVVDLPDAGAVGTYEDAQQSFFDAEAVPQAGFWLGLLGALALAVSGIALATLTPEQLAGLRPGRRRSESAEADRTRNGGPEPVAVEDPEADHDRRPDERSQPARYQR